MAMHHSAIVMLSALVACEGFPGRFPKPETREQLFSTIPTGGRQGPCPEAEPAPQPSCPPPAAIDPPLPCPSPPAICAEAEEHYFPNIADFVIDYDTVYGRGGFKSVFAATLPDGSAGAVGLQDLIETSPKLFLTTTTPLGNVVPKWESVITSISQEFTIQDSLASCPKAQQVLGHGLPNPLAPATYFNFMPASVGGDLTAENWPVPRDESTIFDAVRQLSEGIACMHANGVVHLDIKPANFNARDAARTDFEIADFGFGSNLLTGVGYTLSPKFSPYLWDGEKYIGDLSSHFAFSGGTPGFRPPEMMGARCYSKGDGRYDPFQADIWELGIAFANLVFGHQVGTDFGMGPDCNQTVADAFQQQVNTALTFDGNPELTELLQGMIQINPNKRFTAAQVVDKAAALPVTVGRLLEMRAPSTRRALDAFVLHAEAASEAEHTDSSAPCASHPQKRPLKPGDARIDWAKSVDWAGYGPHAVLA